MDQWHIQYKQLSSHASFSDHTVRALSIISTPIQIWSTVRSTGRVASQIPGDFNGPVTRVYSVTN
jgi:hypothetical protein